MRMSLSASQIQTFKDIILQKDNQLTEVSHMHEQELFRLAAKSDASADLEQVVSLLQGKVLFVWCRWLDYRLN